MAVMSDAVRDVVRDVMRDVRCDARCDAMRDAQRVDVSVSRSPSLRTRRVKQSSNSRCSDGQ
ncbi:MAG: hypothetical protein LBS94_05665, partial [Prevotellaceae bacterium]|nr:hypothetical protein [Prevotellaceae bacterium]